MNATSWKKSAAWYNTLVGQKGHYYHEHVILPNALNLLNLDAKSSILDIGCGQGVFARQIPQNVTYTGIDTAQNLIALAKNQDKNVLHTYSVADATKPFHVIKKDFTHAVAILSLQNMENQKGAIRQVSNHLGPSGKFVIVLNHPSFRIPRQSGWGISENKQQYRYVTRYMSPLKIPITMHPGEKNSEVTWTFHYPLSYYAQSLHAADMTIETINEWISDKESVGKASKMENSARSEIPLFLAIVGKKMGQSIYR